MNLNIESGLSEYSVKVTYVTVSGDRVLYDYSVKQGEVAGLFKLERIPEVNANE